MNEIQELPEEVRRARQSIAQRARAGDVEARWEVLKEAWVIGLSVWRLKLGGSNQCAVCKKRTKSSKTPFCAAHSLWVHYWIPHSGPDDGQLIRNTLSNLDGLGARDVADEDDGADRG